jgi:transcriptional regulator with XRE-family HTH domain
MMSSQDTLLVRLNKLRAKLDKLPPKVLAARLRDLRQKRGISTPKLAAAAGFNSPQAYAHYERGTYKPRPDTVVRLAEALGVRPEWLVRGQR